MKALFEVPGYGRWFAGRSVSWFGDTLMMLVLGLWVKELTGSSTSAGVTLAFFAAPQLLAPFVGFFVDRFSRRAILVLGNALSAVVLLPLFAVGDAGDVWLIWLVTVLYGVSGVILPAASMAMQRSIVPDHLLSSAQGFQQAVGSTFQLIAPVIGAVLFARWGGVGPTILTLVLFTLATLAFVAFRNPPEQARPEESTLTDQVLAGLRHVWRTRPLRHATIAMLIMNLVMGLFNGSIFAVTDAFGVDDTLVALISTVQGLGAIVGALAAMRIVRRRGEIPTMTMGLAIVVLVSLGAAAAPSYWVFLAFIALAGLVLPLVFVAQGTLLQRLTTPTLMGRVMTATSPLMSLMFVLSMSASAGLVAAVSYRVIFVAAAVGTGIAAVYLLVMGRFALGKEATTSA